MTVPTIPRYHSVFHLQFRNNSINSKSSYQVNQNSNHFLLWCLWVHFNSLDHLGKSMIFFGNNFRGGSPLLSTTHCLLVSSWPGLIPTTPLSSLSSLNSAWWGLLGNPLMSLRVIFFFHLTLQWSGNRFSTENLLQHFWQKVFQEKSPLKRESGINYQTITIIFISMEFK